MWILHNHMEKLWLCYVTSKNKQEGYDGLFSLKWDNKQHMDKEKLI